MAAWRRQHYLAGRYDESINDALRLLQHRPTFTGALRLRGEVTEQAALVDSLALARDGVKERAGNVAAPAAGFRDRPALRVGDLDERSSRPLSTIVA